MARRSLSIWLSLSRIGASISGLNIRIESTINNTVFMNSVSQPRDSPIAAKANTVTIIKVS